MGPLQSNGDVEGVPSQNMFDAMARAYASHQNADQLADNDLEVDAHDDRFPHESGEEDG